MPNDQTLLFIYLVIGLVVPGLILLGDDKRIHQK
jgi:hypothetical protein